MAQVDPETLPDHVGAAVVMFIAESGNEDGAIGNAPIDIVTEAMPDGSTPSGSMLDLLGPLVPPQLGVVLTSPFLVLESVLAALASTGEAVIIPFVAGGLALVLPSRRPVLFDGDERHSPHGD